MREKSHWLLFSYFNCKIYYFMNLFYHTAITIFVAEYKMDWKKNVVLCKQVWLVDFIIYQRRDVPVSQVYQRYLINKPISLRGVDGKRGKMENRKGVSEMLEELARRFVEKKMETLKYWAEKCEAELPSDLNGDTRTEMHDNFMAVVQRSDPYFLNKFYFYLAKEKMDYFKIENFLNGYLFRNWPELSSLADSKNPQSPRETAVQKL